MDVIYSIELAIPLYQLGLLLALSTLGLLFGSVRIALIINYVFVLYWGYGLGREAVLGEGAPALNLFNFCYFGFGLAIIVLTLIGLLHRTD